MNPADRFTEAKLISGGILPGMRVLDVGCGFGNVSAFLGKIVGPTGHIVGIDMDANMIRMARERAQKESWGNTEFSCADIASAMPSMAPFDAIVGRRVLMYVPDVVDALRRLFDLVKPGGIAIFQEHDSRALEPMTEMPLRERIRQAIWTTVAQEGGDIVIGGKLCDHFQKAGFHVENIEVMGNVDAPFSNYPHAGILRAMRPRLIQKNVIREEDFDWDKLDMQLDAERKLSTRTYVNEMAYWIFARKNGGVE